MKNTKKIRIAIVESSFRKEVTDALEKNCIKTLIAKGVVRENVTVYRVPGALEIPIVVKKLAQKKQFDAIITFGAILKGKTYHFKQVANECIRGCMDVSWQYQIPLIYEVMAVYDLKDAMERATRKEENKGVEAALTALSMIEILNNL